MGLNYYMAYDPNDPADKAIFDAAIAEALEEAQTLHTAEVERLKNKNTELLGKLAKARKGEGGADTGEIERLEREIEETGGNLERANAELRETKRKLTAVEKTNSELQTTVEKESSFSRNLLVENSLTGSLAEANVAPQFLEAAKALLGKSVVVKEIDGERKTFVGDKSLGDYVKEWTASDAGKPFIQAPANGGSGANNFQNTPPGTKQIWQMNDVERNAAYLADPAGFDARVAAGENVKPKTA